MSEPTIDEMLEEVSRWESFYTSKGFSDGEALSQAIRASLEQHRHYSEANTDLVVIRAFVERVEKRASSHEYQYNYGEAIRDELTTMEKEAE
jgi:hypothetical protein